MSALCHVGCFHSASTCHPSLIDGAGRISATGSITRRTWSYQHLLLKITLLCDLSLFCVAITLLSRMPPPSPSQRYQVIHIYKGQLQHLQVERLAGRADYRKNFYTSVENIRWVTIISDRGCTRHSGVRLPLRTQKRYRRELKEQNSSKKVSGDLGALW